MWYPTERVEMAEPPAGRRLKKKSILLVDDDDLILKLLQKVLASWDASIEVSLNGKDALTKLASRNFDLVICDVHMPEMTGEQLFKHVQDNALLPPRRIIFLTGDRRGEVKEFLDASGCYYLFKPIQFMDFSSHVQAILSDEEM
jgi:CheY-like chemotaxis protein